MSTRAVIARKTPTGFSGVYHHWDGYPEGLGSTLFEIRKDIFKGDTAKMLNVLIDEHPAGWSTINKDWKYPMVDTRKVDIKDRDKTGPEYYPEDEGSGKPFTEKDAQASGCEYAYVFEENGTMGVYSSYTQSGDKMIGAFGCGDENATWRKLATVDLNGTEPDWSKLTN